MRRIWPIAALIIGARLLIGNFVVTTAKNQSFFDHFLTPVGLILIVVGGYFLFKEYVD